MDLHQIEAVEGITGERILPTVADEPDYDLTPCPTCGGSRKIQTTYKGAVTRDDCFRCNGTGNLEGEL